MGWRKSGMFWNMMSERGRGVKNFVGRVTLHRVWIFDHVHVFKRRQILSFFMRWTRMKERLGLVAWLVGREFSRKRRRTDLLEEEVVMKSIDGDVFKAALAVRWFSLHSENQGREGRVVEGQKRIPESNAREHMKEEHSLRHRVVYNRSNQITRFQWLYANINFS